MNAGGTQGLLDTRYKFLKTGALLFLSLDIFYFFACYLSANLLGETVYQFTGLLQARPQAMLPVLLKFTILGYAVVSLPVVIHGKKLALTIISPKDAVPAATRVQSVESAFAHYRQTYRKMLGALSLVNLLAAGCYIAYGEFWLLALVSLIGFINKLVVFPGPRGFNRWMWQALETIHGPTAT